ncbi:helix-turn-helix transcriptional regulator [Salisediminibacterium halotolerans]|uniref:DNA-binding response regulator, NarL/FixJ family, contains REC and HTH domains n=1 Tax=Salisediminibacterium halotolerans TaxID=517425 RepID=A0A1H9TVY2_9BACI|nr:LuxR C-terminal-related transcriptional regulator [Salisediminibacterium haloalkalitolerans]SES01212.1 DNA-binding response regulator, NarL/FixJ family, contains REC and HTH domains [Salisediminibacterium haloalkalitolerans]
MAEQTSERHAVIVAKDHTEFETCRDVQCEPWQIDIRSGISKDDAWDIVFYVYDPVDGDAFLKDFSSVFPIIIVTKGEVTDEILHLAEQEIRGLIRSSYLIEKGADILRDMDITPFVVEPEANYTVARHVSDRQVQLRKISRFEVIEEKLPKTVTKDEMKTLEELVNGNDTDAIAKNRHYSKSTINSQISSLIKKFQLEDRTQLVVEMIRAGYVRSYK